MLATFTVDTIADSTSSLPDGLLSLREAIIASNTNAAYGDASPGDTRDVIRFASSLDNQTITLNAGELTITETVSIDGQVTIDAESKSRIFDIQATDWVVLRNMTLSNGRGPDGGAINVSADGLVALENMTLTGNRSLDGHGGAVYKSAGFLIATDTSFESNLAMGQSGSPVGSGGAIYSAAGRTEIYESTFTANRAFESGGAIHVENGVLEIGNSMLGGASQADGNRVAGPESATVGNGGAIFVSSNSSGAVISETSFQSNFATGNGGGIANMSSSLSVLESTFEENIAASQNVGGGAIYSSGVMQVNETMFEGNVAPRANGGAIYSLDSRLSLRDNSFMSNEAFVFGGAVHKDGGVLNVRELNMLENTASGNGGGLSVKDGVANLFFSRLSGNAAGRADSVNDGMGGAIYGSNAEINLYKGAAISGNSAHHAGGGLAVEGGSLTVSDKQRVGADVAFDGTRIFQNQILGVTLQSGTAVGLESGAGIYTNDVDVILEGVDLSDNSGGNSTNEGISGGGASFVDSDVRITDSKIHGNTGKTGAGLHVEGGSSLSIANSTLSGNWATGKGGGLYLNADSNAKILNSQIGVQTSFWATGANQAGDGGGIYNAGDMRIAKSRVHNNVANDFTLGGGNGGGIFNSGTLRMHTTQFNVNIASGGNGGGIFDSSELTISESTFHENEAVDGKGGAIAGEGSHVDILGASFTANKAGSGGAISFSGDRLYARGARFGGGSQADGNVAEPFDGTVVGNGGAVLIFGDSSAIFNNSNFQNNRARGGGGAIALLEQGSESPELMLRDHSILRDNSTINAIDTNSNPVTGPLNQRSGGAIASFGGTFDIRDTVFERNSALGLGGAIYNAIGPDPAVPAGSTIRKSSFGANAGESAGAIFNNVGLDVFDTDIFDNTSNQLTESVVTGTSGTTDMFRSNVTEPSV